MKGLRPLHASQIFNNRFVDHLTASRKYPAGGFFVKRNLRGGERSRPPRPGPSGPLYAENRPKGRFSGRFEPSRSAPKARLGLWTPFWRTGMNTLSSNFRHLIGLGLTCTMLQKYAATQKMTGNEQARSGHFCLCGYGAKAPLRLASQPHFWSGAARKFGKERTRGWGRPAQQAEDCEAIPKKSDRWLIEFTRIRQLSAFSLAQTALCSPP